MQQDIMSQIQESDNDVATVMIPLIFDESKADLFTTYKWLFPFLQILSCIWYGAVAIVCVNRFNYYGFSIYRTSVWRGNKLIRVKRILLVYPMKQLRQINEEKNLGDGGYQMHLTILKEEALTYVVLAICLLYLIVGELGGLISWILNLASGVVELIRLKYRCGE